MTKRGIRMDMTRAMELKHKLRTKEKKYLITGFINYI